MTSNFMVYSVVIFCVLGLAIGIFKPLPEFGYPANSAFPPAQCYETDAGSLRCDKGPQREPRFNNPKWEVK
jgi:hypothetical protein